MTKYFEPVMCPRCGSEEVGYNSHNDEFYCKKCGAILEEFLEKP